MPEQTIPIARVPLARASFRLVLPPLLLLVTGSVAAAGGLRIGGVAGIALVVAGGVLGLLSLYLAIMLFSVRLDVEVASLHVRWLGGSRRYALARGPVTRVLVRGDGAARLRPRFGAFGWAIGGARLRGSERIEIVRLAPTPTLILVPTDQGRLAIASVSERDLIAALGAAARVQQRLDAAARRAAAESEQPPSPPPTPPRPAPQVPAARFMTGIERAQLEERLAVERAAALAAAEAERANRMAAATLTPAARPAAEPAPTIESALPTGEAAPRGRRARRRAAFVRPGWSRLTGTRALGIGLAILPAVGAGALWAAAGITQALPAGPDLRAVALATALAAAGLLGALVAARWFPRLLGLVSINSVVALILIVRSLLG